MSVDAGPEPTYEEKIRIPPLLRLRKCHHYTLHTNQYKIYIQIFCLFQVYLRIRPMNEDEILIGATHIAHKLEDRVS